MRFIRYDRWGKYVADLSNVFAAKWTRNVDSTRTLNLSLLGETTVSKGDHIVFIDKQGRVQDTIVVSPQHKRASSAIVTSLVCKSAVNELSDVFIEDKRNRGATAAACLTKALEGTRWTVGKVEGTATADLGFYHTFVLDAIQAICDTFGLELTTSYLMDDAHTSITGRAINLVKAQGDQAPAVPRRFEYGRDLVDITRTVDASSVKTRVWGYGKGLENTDDNGDATGGYQRKLDFSSVNGGKAYVEDTAATKLWGIPNADGTVRPSDGMFEDSDEDDPNRLLASTKAYLNSVKTPTISYEASVSALSTSGLNTVGLDLGDMTQIVDTTFEPDLRVQGRVLEMEENLLDPSDTTITLGNIVRSMTDAQKELLKRVNSIESSQAATSFNVSTWDSTSQTVTSNKGQWDSAAQAVTDNKDKWNTAAQKVSSSSARWDATANTVDAGKTKWNSALTLPVTVTQGGSTLTISDSDLFRIASGSTFLGGYSGGHVYADRAGSPSAYLEAKDSESVHIVIADHELLFNASGLFVDGKQVQVSATK